MNFVAFQQFLPVEQDASNGCIWCGKRGPTNRAHVISRKLTAGSRNAAILRLSVCKSCNSKCSELEEWALRFTPLSWARLLLYGSAGGKGTSRHVPSYFFSQLLQEWVVFHLDAKTRSYVIPSQLVRPFGAEPTLLTQAPQDEHKSLVRRMLAAIRDGTLSTDVRDNLPDDFSPRVLLDEGKVILIARTAAQAALPAEGTVQSEDIASTSRHMQLDNTGLERHHFRWSKANWTRFCAKTAYEALCLFEGGDKCLSPTFRTVREFVLCGTVQAGREIVFDSDGPVGPEDVPMPPIVDLTTGQNAPETIAALIPKCEAGMHMIDLYEIRGWILASVVFAGFPPAVLVLGGPNEHIMDFYQLIYDDRDASFDFVRLAYDHSKPIIPLPISGDCFGDLAETYHLNWIDA